MSRILGDQRPAQYAKLLAQGETKTRAALLAGYSRSQARNAWKAIEQRPAVKRALHRYAQRAEASADRAIEEFRRIAFMDVRDYFDEEGNLKPMKDLTREQASCIANLQVIKKNAVAGDGKIDTIYKIDFHDKMEALAFFAKHYRLIDEHVQVDTDVRVTVTWQKADALTDAQQQMIDVTPTDKQEPT